MYVKNKCHERVLWCRYSERGWLIDFSCQIVSPEWKEPNLCEGGHTIENTIR